MTPIPEIPEPGIEGLSLALEAAGVEVIRIGGVWHVSDEAAARAVMAAHVPGPPPAPVPAEADLLKFLKAAVALGVLSPDEALAAARTGTFPAAYEPMLAQLPPDIAYDVRLSWAAMYRVERASPLWQVVTAMTDITAAQLDEVFLRANAP